MHALSCYILYEQHHKCLKGISLPHLQLEYIQASYIDDTHLILHVDLANLVVAKEILELFSQASGLTIHWVKSNARWLYSGLRPHSTDYLQWAWREHDDPRQLLGFAFVDGLSNDLMFSSLVTKLQQRLLHWNSF